MSALPWRPSLGEMLLHTWMKINCLTLLLTHQRWNLYSSLCHLEPDRLLWKLVLSCLREKDSQLQTLLIHARQHVSPPEGNKNAMNRMVNIEMPSEAIK